MVEQQRPDFDSIKQINVYGVEYWRARDLAPLLGYSQWRRFDEAIQRAIIACEKTGNTASDHFANAGKPITGGKGAVQNVKDYHLSRFGCYLIAQNGDPRKPEIAAAQVYFAVSTRKNELHELFKEQQERLTTRFKVSDSYKALGEAAMISGVDSAFFGIFIDAGYLGLHRHTVEELKQIKGVPEHEDYLDNITREELSAIDFKNTQTEAKLLVEDIQSNEEAAQTHYFVGDQVRKAIEAIRRPMPEDLPSAPSIRKMVEERRRNLKKQKQIKPPSDEQGTLF